MAHTKPNRGKCQARTEARNESSTDADAYRGSVRIWDSVRFAKTPNPDKLHEDTRSQTPRTRHQEGQQKLHRPQRSDCNRQHREQRYPKEMPSYE